MEDTKYEIYWLTKKCIPIMLESFKSGIHFYVYDEDWGSEDTGIRFIGKRSYKEDYNHIRVTNDERRRLLPILKKLHADGVCKN